MKRTRSRDIEFLEQAAQQQRNLCSLGASVEVSFVEDDIQLVLFVLGQPFTGIPQRGCSIGRSSMYSSIE